MNEVNWLDIVTNKETSKWFITNNANPAICKFKLYFKQQTQLWVVTFNLKENINY